MLKMFNKSKQKVNYISKKRINKNSAVKSNRSVVFMTLAFLLCVTMLASCASAEGVMVVQRDFYDNPSDVYVDGTAGTQTSTTGDETTTTGTNEGETTVTSAYSTTTSKTQGATTTTKEESTMSFPKLDAGKAPNSNAGRSISVGVALQPLDIVRETPSGKERMVYVNVNCPDRKGIKNVLLKVQTSAGIYVRELIDIDPAIGKRTDTIWLKEPVQASYEASAGDQNGNTMWKGKLTVKPAVRTLVIPQSTVYKVSELPSLSLRGTNYLPKYSPWGTTWLAPTIADYTKEIHDIKDLLNVNTIRFFYTPKYPELAYEGMNFLPATIEKFHKILNAADDKDIKVLMCLMGGNLDLKNLNDSRRHIRTGVEPFVYDGRVLMWDLMNEPGGADGPEIEPHRTWLPAMWEFLLKTDTNHESQVGLTWQFDQLIRLGIEPPVGQYHHYAWSIALPGEKSKYPDKITESRNVLDDVKATYKQVKTPFIIGEFGGASSETQNMTEDKQRELYRSIVRGCEAAVKEGVPITGIYNWCAYVYPTVQDQNEATYGVINIDGTLNLSGKYLRETYDRWEKTSPAPWG